MGRDQLKKKTGDALPFSPITWPTETVKHYIEEGGFTQATPETLKDLGALEPALLKLSWHLLDCWYFRGICHLIHGLSRLINCINLLLIILFC